MWRRFKTWLYDVDLLHYCVRCDRYLRPWSRCKHNGRWSLRLRDR